MSAVRAATPGWGLFGDVLEARIDLMTPVLVVVILSFGAWVCVFAVRQARAAFARVAEAESIVDGVSTGDLWARRAELMARADACSSEVRDAWREFDETLVIDRNRLYNTVSAEEFFNEQRFATRLVGNRFLHVAPVALTTAGLLGTFLGLTVGLNALDLGSTADEMRVGIQTLVHGAALGFTASLTGVFMSLVTNIVERWMERLVVVRLRRLQARIDELFPMRSPEQSLSDIAASSAESREALQVLHEKIGGVLQESVQGVGESTSKAISDAIEHSLAPVMADLAKRAADQSAEVFTEISGQLTASFGEIGERLAVQLKESSESMRGTLDYMGEQLARQADEHLAQMTELQRVTSAQVVAITEATARQSAMLDESLPKIVAGLERASSLIGAATSGMEAATENLERVSTGLGEVSTSLGSTLADAARTMGEVSTTTVAAARAVGEQSAAVSGLMDRAVSAAAGLQEGTRLLTGGFDQMRTSQRAFLDDLEQQLTRHSNAMSGWLASYGDQVTQQTSHRMDEWNKHTETFTSMMLNATSALSDAIDELGSGRAAEPTEAVA